MVAGEIYLQNLVARFSDNGGSNSSISSLSPPGEDIYKVAGFLSYLSSTSQRLHRTSLFAALEICPNKSEIYLAIHCRCDFILSPHPEHA
ncbi:unnamed protein product [Arabidopsis thaliana]|uniref:(thale cress) hypothetical protein n=1 Tax=Arabidopsis thaliana TaxID=3702 RepID=A0A7G2F108_ARATH|nr:unnamed protein product [Arabidopsis thaliana]